MTEMRELPRVTYTGAFDMEPLHEHLDREFPKFRDTKLGKAWPNIIGSELDYEGAQVACFSPLDSSIHLGTYPAGTQGTIEKAVRAARSGYDVWSTLSWRDRLSHMRKLAAALDDARFELAMALTLEVGKNRNEALGEAEEAVALIKFYADELEKNDGFVTRKSETTDEVVETRLLPMGVFAIISPFNYPFALAVNMMSAALVTGNTVVLKPTPNGALVAGILGEIVRSAGLPTGTFNLVFGDEAGKLLAGAEGIDGVAITGSYQAGMTILRHFANGPFMRPVVAELGGKNHAYVDKSADLALAVNGVARSAFNMQGQRCTATSVAYVHESIYDEFLERLRVRVGEFEYGDTTGRVAKIGPLIGEKSYIGYRNAVEHARTHGKVAYGGSRITGEGFERGYFVEPTIVTELPDGDFILKTELFAPILAVKRYSDLRVALRVGNSTQFGLAAGLYASDDEQIQIFLKEAQAGSLYLNRVTGATNGAWPGLQVMCGWKGSGLTNKGALGSNYLPQFMREQSLTIRTVGV